MSTTSLSLLQRVRRREDHVAWERFVVLYTPLLLRWSRRAGLTEQDAVDLVQEVFSILLVELPRFEYEAARGSFRGWLKTVTVNQCRKHHRKRQLAEGRGGDDDVLPSLPGGDAWEAFWDAEYQTYLIRRALDVMKAQFEPRLWQCCWDLMVNEMTAAEIGQKLSMTESAVYVAKFRVIRRLRQELDGLLD